MSTLLFWSRCSAERALQVNRRVTGTSYTFSADSHFADGSSGHVMVDELAHLHQHQRVHVMWNVKVPVNDGADQPGAWQRVTIA